MYMLIYADIYIYTYIYIYIYIYKYIYIMIFTTEEFFEVAVESWPEWETLKHCIYFLPVCFQ